MNKGMNLWIQLGAGNFLSKLSDYWLFKEDSSPMKEDCYLFRLASDS
jgi:hypothetical protein